MHDFRSIGGRGPFEDPNFGFLTVRIIFVYTFCSSGDLHNIREIGKIHLLVKHVFVVGQIGCLGICIS